MAVFTDTAKEQVDAACLNYGLLVVLALSLEVRSVSVENVDVLSRLINMVEKIFVHERVVTLRMLLRKTYILVHVE